MKTCPSCFNKLGKEAVAYCTNCGHQLVITDDLPTLETKVPRQADQQTLILQTVRSENTKLKSEIKELKKNIESTFGGTEEPVEKRIKRILKISGYNKKEPKGWVMRSHENDEGKTEYYDVFIPGGHGNFSLYQRGTNDDDDDEPSFLYIALYSRAVDLENELADIRVLLDDCSQEDVGCGFIMATNEDLSKQIPRVLKAFDEMKTFLPKSERKYYELGVWDWDGLLENEYTLKIKIDPAASAPSKRRKPANATSAK